MSETAKVSAAKPFNPFTETSDADAVLEGLDKVNEKMEARRGAKKEEDKKDQAQDAPKSKYSKDELLAVYDALIFEGTYKENFKGRKISVTLKSRSGEDAVSINRAMDRFEGKTYISVQTYSSLLTLSHSILSFNGVDLSEKNASEKYEFLLTLPDPVLAILFDKLQEFDVKIGDAIREGRENF